MACALGLALVLAPGRSAAQINVLPQELHGVGVQEHLLAQVPLDATFTDQDGRVVRLGEYIHGSRPVVLNLVYYRCPMLCSMVLNSVLHVLQQESWTIGSQFDVVTISIDPRDTVPVAAEKRQRMLRLYNRPGADRGWHFLLGNETSARRVADAVGFEYRYDAQQQQYAHPAVTMLLTPEGRVARYLYGLEYRPNDMRLGLLEASQGRSISTVDRIVLFCYHYDPRGGRYVLVARRVMQLGGVVTMVLLGGMVGMLWVRDRRRQRTRALAPPAQGVTNHHAGTAA